MIIHTGSFSLAMHGLEKQARGFKHIIYFYASFLLMDGLFPYRLLEMTWNNSFPEWSTGDFINAAIVNQ